MFEKRDEDEKEKYIEKQLSELEIKIETMDRDIAQMEEAADVSIEGMAIYAQNPENFTPQEWNYMEIYEKELEAKIEAQIGSVVDKRKSEAARKSLQIEQHWIQVR